MAPITGSVRIDRTPAAVFAYVADPRHRTQWQPAVTAIEVQRTAPAGVGTRVRETRRIQGRPTVLTWEVTEYEPDRRYGLHGIDGPVRPVVTMTFGPLDGGQSTQVGIDVDFQTSGIGKLLGVLARLGARQDVVADARGLKDRLEALPG